MLLKKGYKSTWTPLNGTETIAYIVDAKVLNDPLALSQLDYGSTVGGEPRRSPPEDPTKYDDGWISVTMVLQSDGTTEPAMRDFKFKLKDIASQIGVSAARLELELFDAITGRNPVRWRDDIRPKLLAAGVETYEELKEYAIKSGVVRDRGGPMTVIDDQGGTHIFTMPDTPDETPASVRAISC